MRERKTLLTMLILISVCCVFFACSKREFPPEKVVITGYGAQNPVIPQKEPEKQAPAPQAPQIDNSWADLDVTAIGTGAPPANAINEAQARNMAKRAAKLDALRNLAEQIKGVRIDSKTVVQDFVTQSDEIRTKIDAFIQGAQVIEEKQLEDGSYEVKVGANLKPLSDVIKPQQQATKEPEPAPAPQPAQITTTKPAVSPQQAKLLAKRAAEMDARRNLLEYVKGASINSKTSIKDYMTQNDSIRSEVEGLVKGAQVIATRWNDDGTCEVDVEFDLANVKKLIK